MKDATSSVPLDGLSFQEVEHGSANYLRAVGLRFKLLRKPLGLKYTESQLAAEAKERHLVAMLGEKTVIATVSLAPTEPGVIKLRQVAVNPDHQRAGIGRRLIAYAQAEANDAGARLLFCHSRLPVVSFYEEMGYRAEGEPFEEVGIEHMRMVKEL